MLKGKRCDQSYYYKVRHLEANFFIKINFFSLSPIENIRKLPEKAATFPLLAKLVTLNDVPEVSTTDVKIENK